MGYNIKYIVGIGDRQINNNIEDVKVTAIPKIINTLISMDAEYVRIIKTSEVTGDKFKNDMETLKDLYVINELNQGDCILGVLSVPGCEDRRIVIADEPNSITFHNNY